VSDGTEYLCNNKTMSFKKS